MIPKEKAKELFNKFYQKVADGAFPEENAKQCALIAVDEILKSYNDIFDDYIRVVEGYDDYNHMEEYFQEVKNEIEKL